jgi:hypothetical protein
MTILRAFSYQPHNEDPYWDSRLDIEAGVLLACKFSDIHAPEMIDSNRITWFGNGWGVVNEE